VAEITFVDTTLRDGQQSLWAMNMRTAWMLPALDLIDAAGFDSIEHWVPAVQIRKMIKDLGEDPWPWLHEGTKRAKKTPLRYHGAIDSSLGDVPPAIGRLLVEKALQCGITTTRITDPWNDYDSLAWQAAELTNMGVKVVVNVIYSLSPRHTPEYFVERTLAAAALRPYRICFKDVGGLLTLDVARSLIPKIVAAAAPIPVEFHAHCNNGLAPLAYLDAANAGVQVLHTAVPPLANGTSNPSIFSVARNLEASGHTAAVETEPLQRVAEHFRAVASREGLLVGTPLEFDATQSAHQVPGGMLSNLRHQLAKLGFEDRLQATLEEAARVRAEFGYPIMVTPLSQFVGSQAAVNVMSGERYSIVTDEVILYALGRFGKSAPDLMDREVQEKILDRPRTEYLLQRAPIDQPLDELRKRYGASISDEDLIVRVCGGFGADEPISLGAPGPAHLVGRHPVTDLLQGILESTAYDSVFVSKGTFSLALQRGVGRDDPETSTWR
jgi:oxaloacetate decarboxylase (Na+ extruding) subunit alpha